MYLEKITLNGFKSFAKRIDFEFREGITAIVGPNGSGKSNVADAIRWVLGEQSMKQLRGKKSADVIFSGSDRRARLGMAQVSLYLNNEDGKMPVDYPEVVISRRLFQDGASEYLLNNKEVRLHDIQLLLAQSNFGQRSYSVIGQGMVDEVLAATPISRREFFEEAAGVKQYQIKRDGAVSKLGATWENLQTVQVQIDEIAPRLRSLTRQVKRLQRRTEVEENLRRLQYKYYGHIWHDARNSLKNRQAAVMEIESRREEMKLRVEDLQKQMASLTKDSSHSDRFEKLQQEFQSLVSEKNKLRENELSLKTEIALARQRGEQETIPRKVVETIASEVLNLRNSWADLCEELRGLSNWEVFEAWRGRVYLEDQKWQRLEQELAPYIKNRQATEDMENIVEIREQIAVIDKKLAEVEHRQTDLARFEKKERTKIWQLQNELQVEQKRLSDLVGQENEVRVEVARLETRLQDIENQLKTEFSDSVDPNSLPHEAPSDPNRLEDDMRRLKHNLELIGGIDPDVEKEYEETKERFDYLDHQVRDLRESLSKLESVINDLDYTIKERFNFSFRRIDQEFQKYFKQLFDGGRAKLVLVKPERKNAVFHDGIPTQDGEEGAEVEEESQELKFLDKFRKQDQIGVEIEVSPPGKKLKNISMLSGGERAMTSIALICAIIANNPAPFVVLDEVDAALDEANSIRLADILEELSRKTQFIVITHNRATMEKAGILYGVTMGDDGISQVLSLKLEEAAEHTNR